jgi:kinesin family protein 3/17
MEGKDEPPELRGIIPNTFDYIFQVISRDSG